MTTTIYVPQWGMGVTEGKIVQWLKQVGEPVMEGEPIVEIETAKALQEVEAPASGIFIKILVDEGAVVPVRSKIGEIE